LQHITWGVEATLGDTAGCTAVWKWKKLFMNCGECGIPISTATEVLNALQEGQIITVLRIMLKMKILQ
jgi:hypothetical protein